MRTVYSLLIFVLFQFNLSSQICEINNFIVEPFVDCNEEGNFGIDFEFDIINGANQGFELFVNDEFHSAYDLYPDPFIRIENFWAGNSGEITLKVIDSASPNCLAEFVLQTPTCPEPCLLSDLTVDIGDCNFLAGTYSLLANFNNGYNEPVDFEVYINNNFIDYVGSGADLPITFQNIEPRPDTDYDIIKVCLKESDCCIDLEYLQPVCETDECLIGEIGLDEITTCDDQGQVYLYPYFEYINVSDSFYVHANGVSLGTFAYNSGAEVGPFDANGNSIYQLTVCDQQNPDCCKTSVLGPLYCNPDDACKIFDLRGSIDCQSDNSYFLNITYEHQFTSGMVNVIANSNDYGSFPVDQQPIVLGPFEEGTFITSLGIQDASDPDCQQFVDYDPIPCNEDCNIYDLHANIVSCDPTTGTYSLSVEFQYANPSNELYDVWINNEHKGSFSFLTDPLLVFDQIAPRPGTTYDIVKVCVNDNPECCAVVEYDNTECFNSNECSLEIVEHEVVCDGDVVYINLLYTYLNPFSEAHFYVNGEFINSSNEVGTHDISLGPIALNANGHYEILVKDAELTDCQDVKVLDGIFCNDLCRIGDLILEHECLTDGSYYIYVSFAHAYTSDFVFIQGNGNDYGEFDINEQPMKIGPFAAGDVINELVVKDAFDFDCFNVKEFEPFDCGNNGDCFLDINEAEVYCDGVDYYADIVYTYVNPVTEAHFYVNGILIDESIQIGQQIFITIGPLTENPNGHYEILIKDSQFPDCSDDVIIDGVFCEEEPCFFENLKYEYECLDDNLYTISLYFDYYDFISFTDSVIITGNGQNYGQFLAENQPIILGPFQPGQVINEFVLTGQGNPNCTSFIEIEPIDCTNDNCNIRDISIDILECNPDDGTYSMTLDFIYQYPGNDFFEVWINNEYIGFYPFSGGSSLTFDGIVPRANGAYDIVKVCVNDNPNCCAEWEYMQPDCPSNNDCQIEIIEADAICDGGFVFLNLNYVYNNPFSEAHFYVNGELIEESSNTGTQNIVLGPIPQNASGVYELIVKDAEMTNCQDFIVIDGVSCTCGITGISVDYECLDNGEYYVFLHFATNLILNTVSVVGNGTNYGSFDAHNLPIKLGPFGPNDIVNEFSIWSDNPDDDCFNFVEFEQIVCDPGGECNISDLVADITNCDPATGTYSVAIDFNYQNPTNDLFDVWINNELVGTFTLSTDPIFNFDHIVPRPNSEYDIIKVCVNDNPNCCQVIEYMQPDCTDPIDCEIDILEAVAECDGDFVYITVNYNYLNPFSETHFYVNGEYVSQSNATGNNTITLGPIVSNPDGYYEVLIKDAEYTECRDVFFIQGVFCDEDCRIGAIQYDYECLDNGQFMVFLHFEYFNTSDSVTIKGNGNNYGQFEVYEQPIVLGPFGPDEFINEFVVFDADNPNCINWIDFEPIHCDTGLDCNLRDLHVDVIECDPSNGSYSILVNFISENASNDYFDVWINNEFIGFYPFGTDPLLTFDNIIPRANSDYDIIKICVNDNPNCCVVLDYMQPDCSAMDECLIDIHNVEAICDGDFVYIHMNYTYLNAFSEAHFYVNGEIYAQSAMEGTQNISLGPIPLNPNGHYEILVKDAEFADCQASYEVNGLFCDDDCLISDLHVEHECLDNGEYMIYVHFNSANTDVVLVQGNGQFYGEYHTIDQPIILGPFSSTDLVNELVVTDFQNPDCSSSIDFEPFDCSEDGDCDISGINVEIIECDPLTGTYSLQLDFDYQNPGNNFFEVWINNEYIGFYSFSTDPLLVFNQIIPRVNSLYDIVKICVNDNPDCCYEFEYIAPDCNQYEDCQLDLLAAEAHCDGDFVYIDVVYNYFNGISEAHFYVNGELVAQSADLGNQFITLGPIPINSDGYYEILVKDAELSDCQSSIVVDDVFCDENCRIGDIQYDYDCIDDGHYYIYLSFAYANTSGVVKILGNGHDYGTFSIVDQPIVLGPFGPNELVNEFAVYDVENPNCLNWIDFDPIQCVPGVPCDIRDVVVETFDCNDATGNYSMALSFIYENPGNDFFEVWINDEYMGFFPFSDMLPIVFDNIAQRPNSDYDIVKVCVNDVADCCYVYEYQPNCDSTDPCYIGEIDVEIDCNSDGSFYAFLDIDHANTSGSVNIVGNGTNYGQFSLNQQIVLGPFDGNDSLEFVVSDAQFPDCSSSIDGVEADCIPEDGCFLYDLEVDITDCDEVAGSYDAVVHFSFNEPSNDFFDVWVNNEYYDNYNFAENPPFTISGISPRTNSDYDIIIICVNDDPNCCVELEYLRNPCFEGNSGDACSVDDIRVEPLDCDDPGKYSISLEFETSNFDGDEFYLWINGESLGAVDLDVMPLTFSGISPRENSDYDIVKICLDEDGNCCAEFEYLPPPCAIVSTNEVDQFISLSIYPNPTDGELNIKGIPESATEYRILDQLGREVREYRKKSNQIGVNDLEEGLYFIQFITKDNYIYSKKFIKN